MTENGEGCIIDVDTKCLSLGLVGLPGLLPGVFPLVADERGGLSVVDISRLATPKAISLYELPGNAQGVFVAGDYAFVAAREAGLHVVDVSDPTRPTELGTYTLPEPVIDVFVDAGYAYLAVQTTGLRVLDISNPASPVEVGAYDTPELAEKVLVAGNLAYLTTGYGGLRIIDISDPTDSTGASVYNKSVWTWDVSVRGDYAYVVAGRSEGYAYLGARSAGVQAFEPYTITLRYTDQEKGLAIEETLGLYYREGSHWVREPTSQVDASTNLVIATPDHLSWWAVLGETQRTYLPAVFKQR